MKLLFVYNLIALESCVETFGHSLGWLIATLASVARSVGANGSFLGNESTAASDLVLSSRAWRLWSLIGMAYNDAGLGG